VCLQNFVGNPEEKRPFGTISLRWENNIQVWLREGVNWIHLAEDRDRCEHGNELMGYIQGGEFLG
jgi:hypothetical protein